MSDREAKLAQARLMLQKKLSASKDTKEKTSTKSKKNSDEKQTTQERRAPEEIPPVEPSLTGQLTYTPKEIPEETTQQITHSDHIPDSNNGDPPNEGQEDRPHPAAKSRGYRAQFPATTDGANVNESNTNILSESEPPPSSLSPSILTATHEAAPILNTFSQDHDRYHADAPRALDEVQYYSKREDTLEAKQHDIFDSEESSEPHGTPSLQTSYLFENLTNGRTETATQHPLSNNHQADVSSRIIGLESALHAKNNELVSLESAFNQLNQNFNDMQTQKDRQIRLLSDRNGALESTVQSFSAKEAEYLKIQKSYEETMVLLNTRESKIHELEVGNGHCKRENADLLSKNSQLRNEATIHGARIAELENQLRRAGEELNQQQNRLHYIEAENVKLRELASQHDSGRGDQAIITAQLEQAAKRWESENDFLSARLKKETEEKNALVEELHKAKQSVEECQRNIEGQNNALYELSQSKRQLEAEFSELQSRLVFAQENSEEVKKVCQAAIQESERKMEAISLELQKEQGRRAFDEEWTHMAKKLEACVEEKKEMQLEKANLQAAIIDLQGALAKEQELISLSQKEIQDCVLLNNQLQAEKEQLLIDLETSKQELQELRQTNSEAQKQLLSQVEQVTLLLQDSQANREQLNARIIEMNSQVSKEKEKTASLEDEGRRLSAELIQLQSRVKMNEQAKDALNSELRQTAAFKASLEERLTSSQEQEFHLQTTIANLQSHITALGESKHETLASRESAESMQMMIQTLEDEKVTLTFRLQQLDQELRTRVGHFQNIESRLRETEKEKNQCLDEIEGWRAECKRCHDTMSHLQAMLGEKETTQLHFQSELEKSQQQVQRLQQEKSATMAENQQHRAVIQRLNSAQENTRGLEEKNKELLCIVQSHSVSTQQISLEMARLQMLVEESEQERIISEARISSLSQELAEAVERANRLGFQLTTALACEEDIRNRYVALEKKSGDECNRWKVKADMKDKEAQQIHESLRRMYEATLKMQRENPSPQSASSATIVGNGLLSKSSNMTSTNIPLELKDACSLVESISKIWDQHRTSLGNENRSLMKLFVSTIKEIVKLFDDESAALSSTSVASFADKYRSVNDALEVSVESLTTFAIDQVKNLARIKQHIRDSNRILQMEHERLRAQNLHLQSTLSDLEAQRLARRTVQINTHVQTEDEPNSFVPIAKPRGFSTPLHTNAPSYPYYGGLQRTISLDHSVDLEPSIFSSNQKSERRMVSDRSEYIEKIRTLQKEIETLNLEIHRIKPDKPKHDVRNATKAAEAPTKVTQANKSTSTDQNSYHELVAESRMAVELKMQVEELCKQLSFANEYLCTIAACLGVTIKNATLVDEIECNAMVASITTLKDKLHMLELQANSKTRDIEDLHKQLSTMRRTHERANTTNTFSNPQIPLLRQMQGGDTQKSLSTKEISESGQNPIKLGMAGGQQTRVLDLVDRFNTIGHIPSSTAARTSDSFIATNPSTTTRRMRNQAHTYEHDTLQDES